jgi:hypothetical protein
MDQPMENVKKCREVCYQAAKATIKLHAVRCSRARKGLCEVCINAPA